jgi:hypothetical protein
MFVLLKGTGFFDYIDLVLDIENEIDIVILPANKIECKTDDLDSSANVSETVYLGIVYLEIVIEIVMVTNHFVLMFLVLNDDNFSFLNGESNIEQKGVIL